MNTKNNQRSRITKLLIKKAFLSLMHTKRTGKISVTDICSLAEINRSTFYQHYDEPNSVRKELEDEAISQINEYLVSIGSSYAAHSDAKGCLMLFLHFVKKNDEVFRTLLLENSDPDFRKKMFDLTSAMAHSVFKVGLEEKTKENIYRFLISGSLDLLTEWIRSEYELPEKDLCDLLYTLCEGSTSGFIQIIKDEGKE